jgi:hypothetical protein
MALEWRDRDGSNGVKKIAEIQSIKVSKWVFCGHLQNFVREKKKCACVLGAVLNGF